MELGTVLIVNSDWLYDSLQQKSHRPKDTKPYLWKRILEAELKPRKKQKLATTSKSQSKTPMSMTAAVDFLTAMHDRIADFSFNTQKTLSSKGSPSKRSLPVVPRRQLLCVRIHRFVESFSKGAYSLIYSKRKDLRRRRHKSSLGRHSVTDIAIPETREISTSCKRYMYVYLVGRLCHSRFPDFCIKRNTTHLFSLRQVQPRWHVQYLNFGSSTERFHPRQSRLREFLLASNGSKMGEQNGLNTPAPENERSRGCLGVP